MNLEPPLYTLRYSGLSDIGLHRKNNEDVWSCVPEHNFFVVADGMGGHRAGDIAAEQAVVTVCNAVRQLKESKRCSEKTPEETIAFLKSVLNHANQCVFQLSKSKASYKGMGTTLCCLYFHTSHVFYVHVGDSRIYRLRDGQLIQMTKDHSLLSDLLNKGVLEKGKAESFQHRNIITKAVGTAASVEPTISYHACKPKDRYLLCSDGLSDVVPTFVIEAMLLRSIERSWSLNKSVDVLIESAKKRGGHDNITALLLELT